MKKNKKAETKSVTVDAKKGPSENNANVDDEEVNSGFSSYLRSESGKKLLSSFCLV